MVFTIGKSGGGVSHAHYIHRRGLGKSGVLGVLGGRRGARPGPARPAPRGFHPVAADPAGRNLRGHGGVQRRPPLGPVLPGQWPAAAAEFGVVVAQGDGALHRALADLEALALPSALVQLLRDVDTHWQQLQARIADADHRIQAHARADEAWLKHPMVQRPAKKRAAE